jgi:hypothetical protein
MAALLRPLLAASLASLAGTHASAQSDQPVGGPVQRAATVGAGVSVEIRGSGSFTFDADIDDTEGSVSVGRAGFGLGLGFQAWERARISLGIDSEASWYLFDDAFGIVPGVPGEGDPFELGLTTTFSPRLSVQHDEKWSWFVAGIIEFAGDPDADIGDSGTYGVLAGARYSFTETFALTFGIGAKTRLEDDALVIPLIGIDWKVNDRVTVSTQGTVGKISMKLSDQWSAGLSAGWELRDFRLDDDAAVPDGVLSDSRVPIAVSFDWSPTPNTTISLTGGAVVWQEYEFRNDSEDEVGQTNTDPAPFIGLSAQFRF